MNDLTKKTLSVMWDQFIEGLKMLGIIALIGAVGGLITFAGAKILFMFRDYFDPYTDLDGCFMLSAVLMMVLVGIGVLVYTWYDETKKAVAKYGTSKYGRDRYGKPSGLGGGK